MSWLVVALGQTVIIMIGGIPRGHYGDEQDGFWSGLWLALRMGMGGSLRKPVPGALRATLPAKGVL
jgi:hypothetical protein